MKVIIDRFEGEYAVVELELGQYVNMPKILLPNVKEGDVIKVEVDRRETEKRKRGMQELVNNAFED